MVVTTRRKKAVKVSRAAQGDDSVVFQGAAAAEAAAVAVASATVSTYRLAWEARGNASTNQAVADREENLNRILFGFDLTVGRKSRGARYESARLICHAW